MVLEGSPDDAWPACGVGMSQRDVAEAVSGAGVSSHRFLLTPWPFPATEVVEGTPTTGVTSQRDDAYAAEAAVADAAAVAAWKEVPTAGVASSMPIQRAWREKPDVEVGASIKLVYLSYKSESRHLCHRSFYHSQSHRPIDSSRFPRHPPHPIFYVFARRLERRYS